jgi:hypothetical protein
VTTRNKLLIVVVVLSVVFALGFLPQYLLLQTARAELQVARQNNLLAELRDLAGYMMLETSQKNYGIASGYATRFFELVRQVHDQTTDPKIKQTLAEILAMRDQVTAGLAQGDPAVLTLVQDIFRKVQTDVRGRPMP